MSNSSYSSSEMYISLHFEILLVYLEVGVVHKCAFTLGHKSPFSPYIYHVGSLGFKHLYQLTHLVGPYYNISKLNFLDNLIVLGNLCI